jgi:hypothetical protein
VRVRLRCALACRERLGGLPSSHLGTQTMTGGLEAVGPSSLVGLPENDSDLQPPLHTILDRQLGMKGP